MTIPVLWVSRHPEILARGYADQGLLEAVLDRSLWRPPDALVFEHREVRGDFPDDVDGAVVIINGRTHASDEDVTWLLGQLDRLDWSVLLLCGDEEGAFPWRQVPRTERRRMWVMQGRPEHAGRISGYLPGGWYPGTREHLRAQWNDERSLGWFFAGQITHDRRQACARALRAMHGGRLVETSRYLEEGVSRADYFALMADAKVIPCPSGPYSVDCARAFEALEAGCVPVADVETAHAGAFDYWQLLYGVEPKFPRIWDWSTLPDAARAEVALWPANANRVYAQWQQWKRSLAHRIDDDIRAAAQLPTTSTDPNDLITVIVTTSPVPSHPSSDHITGTINSIRAQLPTAEIIVVADGVRPEQDHQRAAYEQYLQRLLWQCNFDWQNVVPVVLDEWQHQAGATRAALELVTTPLILFVEHDTPLVGPIEWPALAEFVMTGEANVVRFLEDVEINPEHEHLYLGATVSKCSHGHAIYRAAVERDDWVFDQFGAPVRRTTAWWQRPHLASARFYRERVLSLIAPDARTMIEDVMYPIVDTACARGEAGWWDWRLWAYTPSHPTLGMRRSGHTDLRGGQEKWEMVYRYAGEPPVGAPT